MLIDRSSSSFSICDVVLRVSHKTCLPPNCIKSWSRKTRRTLYIFCSEKRQRLSLFIFPSSLFIYDFLGGISSNFSFISERLRDFCETCENVFTAKTAICRKKYFPGIKEIDWRLFLLLFLNYTIF